MDDYFFNEIKSHPRLPSHHAHDSFGRPAPRAARVLHAPGLFGRHAPRAARVLYAPGRVGAGWVVGADVLGGPPPARGVRQ